MAGTLALGLAAQQLVLAQHNHGGGGMSMPSPTVPAARTGKFSGTVVSRDATSIKVEGKQKKAETYMLDPKTIFKGDIQPGADVTVKYQGHTGMQTAISVEAKKSKGKG